MNTLTQPSLEPDGTNYLDKAKEPLDPKSYERLKEMNNLFLESEKLSLQLVVSARKRLYLVGGTLAVIIYTDAIPTEIPALGIDFSSLDESRFILAVAVTTLFLTVNFSLIVLRYYRNRLYWSDVRVWLDRERNAGISDVDNMHSERTKSVDILDGKLSKFRNFFDLVLPGIFGIAVTVVAGLDAVLKLGS